MSPSPGSRLGPYEIVSRLGVGGMGEVWRAKDTRLDRIFAIKELFAPGYSVLSRGYGLPSFSVYRYPRLEVSSSVVYRSGLAAGRPIVPSGLTRRRGTHLAGKVCAQRSVRELRAEDFPGSGRGGRIFRL
jgi:serine/threonine protein kinase